MLVVGEVYYASVVNHVSTFQVLVVPTYLGTPETNSKSIMLKPVEVTTFNLPKLT